MKIRCLLFVLTAILLFTNGYAGDKFNKTGNRISDDTKISVLSSDANKTVINVDVSGFYEKTVTEGDASYSNIYLKDYTSLGETGQASLPLIMKVVAIPNDRDVKVNIINVTAQDYSGYHISPMPEFPKRNGNGQVSYFKDAAYYSRNEMLPGNIVEVKEIAAFRDYRVALVVINPMQYNPAQRNLKVYSEIEFELEYTGYNSTNNVTRSNPNESRSFEKMYENLILNYEQVRGTSGINEAPNMLIITADALYNGVLPLAQWKNQKGIRTEIATLTDIAPNASSSQIKAFIKGKYDGSDRPEFVLLIGDSRGQNIVPWFTEGFDKTDHPYSCLNGTDVLPDIALGRISVQSLPELDKAVTKLIQYEKQPNTTQTDWYKRALVLHSLDGIDPINGQVAKNVFLNYGGFTNVDMASPSTSQAQITNYLNGGVSWVWFIGHGYEEAWADPYWHMSNMPNLTYGTRAPSIISIACSNADLDWSETSDCFGEAFIERSPTNSASNICASTELCAFYTTDTLGRYMLYGYFREDIGDFGSMMNYGKINAYTFFGGNGTVTETNNQFMVLGDPSQEAFSDVPQNLTVVTTQNDGPNALITVNVKSNGVNVEGAMVGINQDSELKTAGYTNANGDFEFSSNVLVNGTSVQAVVTGRNYVPYIQDIITNVNFTSEIPTQYELAQNYPNPFNPSTMIKFGLPNSGFVTLKVYDALGKEVAQLVNGNLNAGTYNIDFNAQGLSSGVYFYRISAGDFTEIRKMVLMK
jgi:gingipain R